MQNLKDGKLPQNEVFWSDLNTWTEVRLVCREDSHTERIVTWKLFPSLFPV